MKCLPSWPSGEVEGTTHISRTAPNVGSAPAAGVLPADCVKPAACAEAAPAAWPSTRQSASANLPRAEPTDWLFWPGNSVSGTNARMSWFHLSLPRDCENRCTVGCQPPDDSTMAQ